MLFSQSLKAAVLHVLAPLAFLLACMHCAGEEGREWSFKGHSASKNEVYNQAKLKVQLLVLLPFEIK